MASRNPPIKYLANTRIDEKGRLKIPKQVLEEIGLQPDAPFTMLRLGDALLLLPQQQFEKLCQRISQNLTNAGVTAEIALATLPEARKRVFARHYGRKRDRQR